MKRYIPQQPTEEVCSAIERILKSFWELVLRDFATCLAEEPDQSHTGHLFVSFVDVLAWLSGSEVWPADFVIMDVASFEDVDLRKETLKYMED